jgi:hypothetical protein
MTNILYLILKYETLTGSIIGAFVAAIFGILTQIFLDRSKDRTEAKKIVELVKNEMDLNYQLARQMAITKEAVYEFQTDYYDRFLDKIMLIKDDDLKTRILDIYTGLKLYNAGINCKYGLIIMGIRELNEAAKWGLEIETEDELAREISIYQSMKSKGLIEAKLENYEGIDKRGYYGIICSILKLSDILTKISKN